LKTTFVTNDMRSSQWCW